MSGEKARARKEKRERRRDAAAGEAIPRLPDHLVVTHILRSENVSGDEVVGEPVEGLARGSIAAALAPFLSRASFFTGHRVGRVDGFVSASCATLCQEASQILR
jgi:hypothetical protein